MAGCENNTPRSSSNWWMRGAAFLVLLSWLGVFAAAMAPVLHQHVHSDAESESHTCLVTAYADGLLNAETPVAFLPLPALVETPSSSTVQRTPVLRSPPKVFSERGPPFLG